MRRRLSLLAVLSCLAAASARPDAPIPKENIGAIAIVNSQSPNYPDFLEYTKLYLDHFDVPYMVWDIAHGELTADAGHASLLILGHNQIGLKSRDVVRTAVESGAGLLAFDGVGLFEGRCEAARTSAGQPITIRQALHYITQRKERGQEIKVRGRLPVMACGPVPGGFEVLASAGELPLVMAGHHGKGRAVVFSSYAWLDPEHLGFFAGMDDVFWRSMVWAARKPFVMQGMPPLVSFRIDDCAGGPKHDWAYIEAINRVGIVPHGTFFLDDIDEANGRKMAELVHAAKLQVSVHARTNDIFFWWDRVNDRPFDDATMKKNYEDAVKFFRKYGIQHAKSLNIHWEEMGRNSEPYMRDLGIEFVVSWTNFGMPVYRLNQFLAAPYLIFRPSGYWKVRPSSTSTGQFEFGPRAVMDWLDDAHTLFDNYVEPSDIKSGSDWLRKCSLPPYSGTFEDAGMILDSTTMLKREMDSMFPAYYFTHEVNINRYDTGRFAKLVRAVWDNLAAYQPEAVSYDDLNRYARAQVTSHMDRAMYSQGKSQITVRLSGRADVKTRYWVYTGTGDSISERMEEVPPFKGAVEVQATVREE